MCVPDAHGSSISQFGRAVFENFFFFCEGKQVGHICVTFTLGCWESQQTALHVS